MAQLAGSFRQYSAWREALARSIGRLSEWLAANRLLQDDIAQALHTAHERLAEDKFVIAFVAEFSRGKSELINALFFAEYGQRILPSSSGRTTMCPTELRYDESLPACIRALPIETRALPGSTSDFRQVAAEWQVFPVDVGSPASMREAFGRVAQTVRVSVETARSYGLYDDNDPDHAAALDAQGMVEISRWRHAIINLPHPLLQQGLVILDTPGLNALGTEPELTMSLVPGAHAVLFVLAADTGVTRSDMDLWRNIATASMGMNNSIAVLNKIDGLWDALKSEAQIEAEITRQVDTVAATLDLDRARIFPVSAQKGLVGKITRDAALIERSRLLPLESALVDRLLSVRQRIVCSQTLAVVGRIGGEVGHSLAARERSLREQAYELLSLGGKNAGAITRLLRRAESEQHEFEESVRRIVAARAVLKRLGKPIREQLGFKRLRVQVQGTRERMRDSPLTAQMAAAANDYFADLREVLRTAQAGLGEVERMILAVHRRFAEDQGWTLPPPMSFSLDAYLSELERLELACRAHFGVVALLTSGKAALIGRFFDTVAARSREIFSLAEKDTEAWLRSLLPPLETHAREQRAQLRRRTESVGRVRDAKESLQARIEQVEDAIEDLVVLQSQLNTLVARTRVLTASSSAADAVASPGQAPLPQVEPDIEAQALP